MGKLGDTSTMTKRAHPLYVARYRRVTAPSHARRNRAIVHAAMQRLEGRVRGVALATLAVDARVNVVDVIDVLVAHGFRVVRAYRRGHATTTTVYPSASHGGPVSADVAYTNDQARGLTLGR